MQWLNSRYHTAILKMDMLAFSPSMNSLYIHVTPEIWILAAAKSSGLFLEKLMQMESKTIQKPCV